MSTTLLALVLLFTTRGSALARDSACNVRFVPVLDFSEPYIHCLWQCRAVLAFKKVNHCEVQPCVDNSELFPVCKGDLDSVLEGRNPEALGNN